MPANTTPDNLVYPVPGDNIGDLHQWFAQLAGSAQTALTGIRSEVVQPELPFPQTVVGANVQTVSATAWADLPNIDPITLTLSQPAWVKIDLGAWMVAATGDTRASVRVSGATVLAEAQTEVGGQTDAWGQVIYLGGAGATTHQCTITRTIRMNAGTNTIKVRAYRTGGATESNGVNYSTMTVTPVRWA